MEETPAGRTGCWDREQDPKRRTDSGAGGGGQRDEDKVGQGGGVAEECLKAQRWGSWRRSPDEQRDSSLLETVAWLTKFT